jgi:DNA-binding HxlR family transcriptional regulator
MSPPAYVCTDFVADCRVRLASDLLAHTWDPVILLALKDGPRRRADLRSWIGGISDKALTESLRRLLASGLVDRTRRRSAPPRVDYALTPLGVTFVDGPLMALGKWAHEHGDDVVDALERAAQAQASSPARDTLVTVATPGA